MPKANPDTKKTRLPRLDESSLLLLDALGFGCETPLTVYGREGEDILAEFGYRLGQGGNALYFLDGEDLDLNEVLKSLSSFEEAAIIFDNRYGFRYFSGQSSEQEDIPFSGIEEGKAYSLHQVLSVLEKTLKKTTNVFFPFPDYRNPKIIYSESCLPESGSLRNLVHATGKDRIITFNEEKALDASLASGDFASFAPCYMIQIKGPEKEKVTLAAYDLSRKPSYRLLTQMVQRKNAIHIIKSIRYEETKPFLDSLEKGHRLMADIYGDKNVPAILDKNPTSLTLSYVKGVSLQALLIETIKQGKQEEAKALLTRYRDFILSGKDNSTAFASTPEFESWFGETSYQGDALKVANIDVSFTNVLVEEGKMSLFDCEWVMPFAIPTKYLFYRAVSEFINKQPSLFQKKGSSDFLFDLFDIQDSDKAVFAQFEAFFRKAVLAPSARKDIHVSYVLSENKDLRKENETKQHTIDSLSGEKSHLEEIRRSLEEEKASLQEEGRQKQAAIDSLTEEKAQLEETKQSLEQDVASLQQNNAALKEEGERTKAKLEETTFQSERYRQELETVHNSTMWRFASRYYKIRDFFLPPHSRRRLIVKTMVYGIRHPIICFRALRRGKGKDYFRALKHDPALASAKMDNYAKNMANVASDPDLILFKEKEFKPITLPTSKKPLVSIIIPVYNQFDYTYNCLLSILAHTDTEKTPYEVIIGDDCSSDETTKLSSIVSGVIIARNKTNTGFLKNCNNAAKKAKGKYVYFLNNDTNVQPGYLTELVSYIEAHPECGACGSKLVYANGMLQEAGGIFWKDGSAWNYGNKGDRNDPAFNYVKEADYISGASLMIRKDVWTKLGGFDETFAPAYCEDSDICFSIRHKLGLKVIYIPTSVVVHFEGISNGTDVNSTTGLKRYQVINQAKFVEKWKKELANYEENGVNVFFARDRRKGKKTILFVDHYVPHYDKDAGSRTTFAYLKMLAEMGYNVKFIGDNFYRHEPYTTALQKLGIEVLYGEKMFHGWKNYLQENGKFFDYVYLTRPHIAIKYIDEVRASTKAKVLYYGQDLCMLRLQREYEITHNEAILPEIAKFKELEETLMEKADLSLYPSMVEVDYVKEHYPDYKVGYQQAFAIEEEKPQEKRPRSGLLFVGGFGHSPNVDGCLWFVKEVFPLVREKLPNLIFTIVGSNPTEEIKALHGNGVNVRGGISDEELSKAYAETTLVIAPLRYGAGIKGKIVEAMGKGLPIVTTSIGAEGIVDADKAMAIADTKEDFASAIIALYQDEEKQAELVSNAKKIVASHYSAASAKAWIKEVFPQ